MYNMCLKKKKKEKKIKLYTMMYVLSENKRDGDTIEFYIDMYISCNRVREK